MKLFKKIWFIALMAVIVGVGVTSCSGTPSDNNGKNVIEVYKSFYTQNGNKYILSFCAYSDKTFVINGQDLSDGKSSSFANGTYKTGSDEKAAVGEGNYLIKPTKVDSRISKLLTENEEYDMEKSSPNLKLKIPTGNQYYYVYTYVKENPVKEYRADNDNEMEIYIGNNNTYFYIGTGNTWQYSNSPTLDLQNLSLGSIERPDAKLPVGKYKITMKVNGITLDKADGATAPESFTPVEFTETKSWQ